MLECLNPARALNATTWYEFFFEIKKKMTIPPKLASAEVARAMISECPGDCKSSAGETVI
jgi:hypothetical protein